MSSFKPRVYSYYYVAALLIIAILSISSHLILDFTLSTNNGFARLINVSGRQRMYSQRIASLSAQYYYGDQSAKKPLIRTIVAFESSHQKLVNDKNVHNNTKNSRKLYQLYYSGDNAINSLIDNYVREAWTITNNPPHSNRSLTAINALSQQSRKLLLSKLDQVVATYQEESERRINILNTVQWSILFIVLLTLLFEATFLFHPMFKRIRRFTEQLLKLATTDYLTNISNRRHFIESCDVVLHDAKQHFSAVSLIMLDVDHFKQINDTYGHSIGDEILIAIAEQMRNIVRNIDFVGRLGGEEFAILLPGVKIEDAKSIAERLKNNIAKIEIKTDQGIASTTISIGLTTVQGEDIDTALKLADKALYAAKANGRNQVFIL